MHPVLTVDCLVTDKTNLFEVTRRPLTRHFSKPQARRKRLDTRTEREQPNRKVLGTSDKVVQATTYEAIAGSAKKILIAWRS